MTGGDGGLKGLRDELRQILGCAERWLVTAAELDAEFNSNRRAAWAESQRSIHSLRARAVSTLITVAFVGKFSSGKSFLISGLQKRLSYGESTNDAGILSERYLGLLHSASRASTTCPVTVVPVDTGRSTAVRDRRYRVRFDGDDDWEELGDSLSPVAVAAYTSQDPQAVERGRSAAHRDRVVAEVEILLAETVLPAKLYELPGLDSPYLVHDLISNSAWRDADCFVYVTQATRTLDRQQQELVTRLYQHHLRSGKRIIWVLTGIDRANSVNLDGEPEWMDTVRENNAYLTDNFPGPVGRVDTFQGAGFIGVSPAWEAKGRWHTASGETEKGRKLVSASRMHRLRETLTDLINSDTGRRRLLTVAIEARVMLMPHQRMLVDLLESARLPLHQLSSEREDLNRRLVILRGAITTIREQFHTELQHHVRVTERSFHGLADLLRLELAEEIGSANLKNVKVADRLEIRKAQIVQNWVTNHGPERVWDEQFREFSATVLETVRATLRDASRTHDVATDAGAGVDISDITVRPSRRYRPKAQDVVQQLAGFITISTPVATALAAAVGLLTGPVVAIPASVSVLAGMIYAYVSRSRAEASELKALRQHWIEDLDLTARVYRESYAAMAQIRGTEMIDRAMEILSERAEEMSRRILLVETRLAEPEYADLGALVTILEPQVRYGAELLESLRTMQ